VQHFTLGEKDQPPIPAGFTTRLIVADQITLADYADRSTLIITSNLPLPIRLVPLSSRITTSPVEFSSTWQPSRLIAQPPGERGPIVRVEKRHRLPVGFWPSRAVETEVSGERQKSSCPATH